MSPDELERTIRDCLQEDFPSPDKFFESIKPLSAEARITVMRTLVAQMFASPRLVILRPRLQEWLDKWQKPLLEAALNISQARKPVIGQELSLMIASFSASNAEGQPPKPKPAESSLAELLTEAQSAAKGLVAVLDSTYGDVEKFTQAQQELAMIFDSCGFGHDEDDPE